MDVYRYKEVKNELVPGEDIFFTLQKVNNDMGVVVYILGDNVATRQGGVSGGCRAT